MNSSRPVRMGGKQGIVLAGAGGLNSYADTQSVVIVPSYGLERETDTGLETWTSPTNLTYWGESISGSSSLDREATVKHSGSFAAALTVDGSNSNVYLVTLYNLAADGWYELSAWMRADSGTPTAAMTILTGVPGSFVPTLSTTYTQFSISRRGAATKQYVFGRTSAAGRILYFDDISVRPITLSSTLATVARAAFSDMAVSGAVTLAESDKRHQAGVAINLDSGVNPQNGVFAFVDTSQLCLEKCVNGTWTNLITTTVTYVAGRKVEIRKTGTSYGLYYNNAQVGTTQTISDTSVINNKLFGRFSTGGGAAVANLSMQRYPF